MSFLTVVTIVVLFSPLNFSVVLFSKKYLMAFLAGYSGVIVLYSQAASIFFQLFLLTMVWPL